MKILGLIFITIFTFAGCEKQTSQISENKSQGKHKLLPNQETGTGQSGRDQGNPKFRTTSIKYYLGCWQPEKKFKPRFEPKSEVFYITEETIQTSKMFKPIPYEEVNSGNNKDYFVLQLKSKDESKQLTPYIYIFMALDTEVDISTLEEFATEDSIQEHSKSQWKLTKVDCQKVADKFKK